MADPLSILGSQRLLRWFDEYEPGAWHCVVGSGDAVMATAVNQPPVALWPSGRNYPHFDGAMPNVRALIAPPIAGYTYSPTKHLIAGLVLRVDQDVNDGLSAILALNSDGGLNDACLELSSAFPPTPGLLWGDANTDDGPAIVGGQPRTLIVVRDGGTGVNTMYIDGVAQAATGSGTPAAEFGAYWGTDDLVIGTQPAATERRLSGAVHWLFFAADNAALAPFVADLHAALAASLVEVPVGPQTYEFPFSATADGTANGRRLLNAIKVVLPTVAVVDTGDETIFVTFPAALSVPEVATLAAVVAAHVGGEPVKVIPTPTRGDLLYFDGEAWIRLQAGPTGTFLQSMGPGADPQWVQIRGSSFVPTLVDDEETFSVPDNAQALYTAPIVIDGEVVLDGDLIEVD